MNNKNYKTNKTHLRFAEILVLLFMQVFISQIASADTTGFDERNENEISKNQNHLKKPWTASDLLLGYVSGLTGTLLGGASGVVIGYLTLGPYGPGAYILAAGSAILGNTMGVYIYGESTDHDGNFWAALGGTIAGAAAGYFLIGYDWVPNTILGTLALPQLGATVGYGMSVDSTASPVHTHQTLNGILSPPKFAQATVLHFNF